MIRVFGETDREFNSNGDAVLKPLKAQIKKVDNGDFYLDLECNLTEVDFIQANRIVVAPTPQGVQPFRIQNPIKTRKTVKAKCPHVYFDAQNFLIQDSYVVDKDCNAALDHLNKATEPATIFTTISDVENVTSFRCVRKSLAEAVNTVLDRWGGHLVRDGWSIGVRASIGADNGVTVRYAKNLREISVSEDWSQVVTKLLPVGRDGILLNELDPSASVYVEAETSYPIPFTKTVSFSQDVLEDDYRDEEGNLDQTLYKAALVADLAQQAQEYVEANAIPKVNYTLKAHLEKITDIGDTIEVIDERLKVNLLTNVISYTYDCLLDKYLELEFGNFQKSIKGLAGELQNTITTEVSEQTNIVKVTLSDELQSATDQILSIASDSFVIYDGSQIMIVDRLPKEESVHCIRINSAGIGFSNTGINGVFNSAWTIDGTLDMQAVNVINLTASMIRGGVLKLGGKNNGSGILEVYSQNNDLIGLLNKDGLKVFGNDGSHVVMNATDGFAGYDSAGNKIYWAAADEFHMRKSVVEEEITLCNKLRFIPITIVNGNTIVNDGIGLVSSQ